MTLTIEDITRLVGLQLGKKGVQPTDRIVEDLGAESADIVNIIATAEEKYDIFIDESELAQIQTVNELYDAVQSRLQ